MNDIRRTILWVIFAFSLVMLWDQWQVYNGHKATFFPSASNVAARASAPASAAASATPPAASATAVPAATSTSAPPSGAPAAAALPRERIEVQTDVLKLVFDTEGG
nr:membrane protein insertase YidC [Ottowia sp.]